MPILAIGIILAVGIGFLIFYLVKQGIISGKTAAAANYLDKNKNLQAIKAGKAAVEKDPKNAEAHYYLGKALLADNREEQALREFKSVSRLGIEGKNIPEAEFRQTIAVLYVKYNEPEEALKEYLLLIKSQPENAEYHFLAGCIFSKRNRSDLANNYFNKAISLNPKEAKYYVELGIILYQEKKLKEAETTLDSALKLDSGNMKSLFYKGKVFKDGKDYAGALPFFEKASRDQEYKLRSLVESGSCYMSLKMIDRAIAELERAVKIIENDIETEGLYARYFLGMCYEKKQNYPKAVEQWEKIYSKKKNFRDVGEKLMGYQEYRRPM
jgi:tetratricopeptide (TPR) repeat protein